MSFDKIISIPGKSGLFKMIAQMRNGGFVVEGLTDGKRMPVSAMQRITMLKDISVYTIEDDIPLEDVFRKMKDQDALASSVPTNADPADLKSTLKKILPEFDEERVHASDIRKMFSWYGLLKDIITDKPAEEVEETKAPEEKAAPKKKAAKTEEVSAATDEAPAKKTAPKKKAKVEESTEGEAKPAKKTAAKKTAKKTE